MEIKMKEKMKKGQRWRLGEARRGAQKADDRGQGVDRMTR
jgi:hypothetical protein